MSTIVSAALEDGIGIVALTNADTKAEPILKIILKVAEKAFGSRDSLFSPPATATTAITRRRSNPDSLLPRHDAGVAPRSDGVDLTGTYHNAGYGTGILCSVYSTSSSCKSVLDAFRSISSLSPKSTDLFASWPTLFSTHIRFTHTNSNGQYVISAGSIYPKGYGKNTTAFSTLLPAARAEFVVKNGKVLGFGWNNIVDGGAVKRAGSVEETSEVWFVKQT